MKRVRSARNLALVFLMAVMLHDGTVLGVLAESFSHRMPAEGRCPLGGADEGTKGTGSDDSALRSERFSDPNTRSAARRARVCGLTPRDEAVCLPWAQVWVAGGGVFPRSSAVLRTAVLRV